MAYGQMSNDELYGDSGSQDQSPSPEEPKEDQGEKSAVLPKALCPGMKPGDTIELDIKEVRGDSYVVTYTPENAEKEKAEQEQPSAPPPPEGGGQGGAMDSMMG